MKRFLFLTLMVIPLLSTSQNETRNFETFKVPIKDSVTNQYFLYRISFDNITTLELSKTIIQDGTVAPSLRAFRFSRNAHSSPFYSYYCFCESAYAWGDRAICLWRVDARIIRPAEIPIANMM